MSTVAGIIGILTTSPIKDFLISCGAGASWDGAKKIASHFKKDSIEREMWSLLSDTMAQFYEQMYSEFKKPLEFDERIVITSLNDIKTNVFSERNLMLQRIEAKLGRFVGNENHTEGLFQESIDKLYALFDLSWKNEILTLINKLPKNFWLQEKITEKMDLIDADEDCELVLSVLEDLFNLHDFTKAPYELVQRLKDYFRYPHFNKALIVTGTAGAGKSFFIKEYVETAVSKIKENDISILPCIIDISGINRFQNFSVRGAVGKLCKTKPDLCSRKCVC